MIQLEGHASQTLWNISVLLSVTCPEKRTWDALRFLKFQLSRNPELNSSCPCWENVYPPDHPPYLSAHLSNMSNISLVECEQLQELFEEPKKIFRDSRMLFPGTQEELRKKRKSPETFSVIEDFLRAFSAEELRPSLIPGLPFHWPFFKFLFWRKRVSTSPELL